MRKYIASLLKQEDGMETIEFVIILAIVAGLIAIVVSVGNSVRERAETAKGQIETGLAALDQ